MLGAQSLRDPNRFLHASVVIDEADADACELQRAADLPFGSGIMVQIADDQRSRHARHEIRDRFVGRRIDADTYDGDSSRPVNSIHVHLLPGLPGTPVSNCFGSNGAIGIWGSTGPGVSAATGSTIVGVTITSSSELSVLMALERNSCPRIGMSPIPRTLAN